MGDRLAQVVAYLGGRTCIPAYMHRNETTFETALRSVSPRQSCAGWLVDVSISAARHRRPSPHPPKTESAVSLLRRDIPGAIQPTER
jgi:hypothetical protein